MWKRLPTDFPRVTKLALPTLKGLRHDLGSQSARDFPTPPDDLTPCRHPRSKTSLNLFDLFASKPRICPNVVREHITRRHSSLRRIAATLAARFVARVNKIHEGGLRNRYVVDAR